MDIKYDIASPDDIPRIVDMKIEMFRQFDYVQYLHNNSREIILEDYSRMYAENQATHFIAKVDNCIVGIVGAFIKSDIPFRYFSKGQYGFIGDVYTITTYRNRGISMKLNEKALTWLKDYGVSSVRLLASDAGRPIYERLGFSPDVSMVLDFET
ncbi:MAG: GNAT superfamily N-acetyltransferase [Parasphingorhabdus sp.]|jgi:GNAT superfamily N-acetyltransferase